MMRLSLFFLVILFICNHGTADAEEWTVDRAVAAAVAASRTAGIERLDAHAIDLDTRSASTGWLPNLTMSAGANVVSDVMEIPLPFKSIRFGDYDSYDFAVGFRQLLYDGGRIAESKKTLDARSRATGFRADIIDLETAFRTRTAFWTLAMTQRRVAAESESIRRAEIHLRDAEIRLKEGTALQQEVLSARFRVSQTRMDLTTAEAECDRNAAVFRMITDSPSEMDISLVWDRDTIPPIPEPDIAGALSVRPETKALNASIEASRYMEKQALSVRRPTLGLFGAFHYGRPGLDMPANDWMHYFIGGVSLSWNVWDWGDASRNAEKAHITGRQSELRLDDFQRSLARELDSARATYREVSQRAALAVEAREVAKARLDLVEAAYREGAATETDYDSAHADYAKAVIDESVAAVSVRIVVAQIDYILGCSLPGNNGGINE